MGRLWRRASGALKDRNSILAASLARRTAHRHPRVESTVIRATSHDDRYVDYSAAKVVFRLINASPMCLRAFLWALSNRMERTRSWVVALKGVILMHGALTCKTHAVKTIGRLPFDLSNFTDQHAHPNNMWGFNAFVRSYFAFVDHKSALMFADFQEHTGKPKYSSTAENKTEGSCMLQQLFLLQRLQGLLDMLLKIKPEAKGMHKAVLILEAMNCVIIDIYGIYSRICNGIAQLLLNICSTGRTEASMALKILHKSREQSEELSMYIDHCKEMKVDNALKCLRVEQVPEEDFWEVERMVSRVSAETDMVCSSNAVVAVKEDLDLVLVDPESNRMKTLITNKWEVFDEDFIKFSTEEIGCGTDDHMGKSTRSNDGEVLDPFAASLVPVPVPFQAYVKNQEVPDLISFL